MPDIRELGGWSEAEAKIKEFFPHAVIEIDTQSGRAMVVVHTNWWVTDGGYRVTEKDDSLAV